VAGASGQVGTDYGGPFGHTGVARHPYPPWGDGSDATSHTMPHRGVSCHLCDAVVPSFFKTLPQKAGGGEAWLRPRPRRGGRLGGERPPGRTAGGSGTPRPHGPSSSPTLPSVPLRRSGLRHACRWQKHNRARQGDGLKRHGKAALVIGRWPRGSDMGPDVACCCLLHVISKVVRWRVASVHRALSRLFARDSPTG
jgi:hypothetical protein